MATNKKITQLDELTPATWADDDVIAIVDISAQETKKIQLSTFRGAVTGVSSLNASTPLTVDSATGDVTISVAINGGGTINAVFDEDNMSSNSPTALATQQSIKAYVDSQVGTVDTLAEILSNGNTSGGTNIVVSSGDVITTNTINETTAASGVTIDGVLVKDGQVDGRDVSVDGTKLDTVETNADVTDTANVTAAGALMDSELTNITAVKALDQGVATTDTPTFAGLITAGNVDGRDVSADGAKLDGIEAGADVTDTTNVTAAGALMDSELTNIAAVKALNQGVATTDSPSFAGLTATTADINGGTIDGTVIGGASAAAGTFTTFTSTGIDDNATSTAITIDSSENVGIGTVSPSSLLNIYINSLSDREALVLNSNGGVLNGASIDIRRSNVSMGKIDADYFEGMRFYVTDGAGAAATERMRIDAGGNVGIGTSSPTTRLSFGNYIPSNGQTIHTYQDGNSVSGLGIVAGMHRMFTSSGADLSYGHVSSSDGSTYTERMRINSSGNVGIGTSSPENPMTIQDVAGSTFNRDFSIRNGDATNYHRLILGYNAGSVASGVPANAQFLLAEKGGGYGTSGGLVLGNSDNAPVIFTTNATERMQIDSSGNVGIGTTPSQALDVVTASSNAYIRVARNALAAGQAGLQINGGTGGVDWYLFQNTGSNDLTVFGNGSERMRIDSSGNVGINVSAPHSALEVNTVASTPYQVVLGNSGQTSFLWGIGREGVSTGNLEFRNTSDGFSSSTVRMSIAQSGNVGIGTAFPSQKLEVAGNILATGGSVSIGTGGLYQAGSIYSDATWGMIFRAKQALPSADFMWANSANVERMRIDSSGNLLVGTTTVHGQITSQSDGTKFQYASHNTDTSGVTQTSFRFMRNTADVGSITTTSSATAYNTSSDYRLKENVVDLSGAIDRVKSLKPSRFNFIADPDTTVDGFVAHEVSDVVPEAICGEKDAVDAEGNPEYQGIDQSKLVPLLTAALQEALAKIEELEARVAALETA